MLSLFLRVASDIYCVTFSVNNSASCMFCTDFVRVQCVCFKFKFFFTSISCFVLTSSIYIEVEDISPAIDHRVNFSSPVHLYLIWLELLGQFDLPRSVVTWLEVLEESDLHCYMGVGRRCVGVWNG